VSSATNILVIDDEPAILKTLSAALEEMGHRVATAVNGKEALTLIRKQPYDVVVADIKLPAWRYWKQPRNLIQRQQ